VFQSPKNIPSTTPRRDLSWPWWWKLKPNSSPNHPLMPSSLSWLTLEMPLTENKLTTTKSITPNPLNVNLNTNSEMLKSLTPPSPSETHPPNSPHVKTSRSRPKTIWKSMNNKPSPTKNTWESFSHKEMLKNPSTPEEVKISKMPLVPSKKPKISSLLSTPVVVHSLKLVRSPRRCSNNLSPSSQPPHMPPSWPPSLN